MNDAGPSTLLRASESERLVSYFRGTAGRRLDD